MANEPPVIFDEDNPEWTEQDFARARPAEEMLPTALVAALKRGRGRPPGSRKSKVTLRLDDDVIARFQAAGRGWQTRINDVLRRAG